MKPLTPWTTVLTAITLTAPTLLLGCGSSPNREAAQRQIGQAPTDYRSRIRRHLGDRQTGYGLKYESNYDFADPLKAAYKPRGEDDWHYGYAVTAKVSTPVRQTGQIRRRPYIFFFDAQDDQMIEFQKGDEIEELELE